MKIQVKYHSQDAKPIQQAHIGEWFDLRAGYPYDIHAGEHVFIDLGVSIRLPHDYEAIVAPRSSLFKKHGLLQTNGIGVIDEKYCGEGDIWKLSVYATRDCHINAGERIAQFRIQRNQGGIEVEETAVMTGPNRGGFGSTDD